MTKRNLIGWLAAGLVSVALVPAGFAKTTAVTPSVPAKTQVQKTSAAKHGKHAKHKKLAKKSRHKHGAKHMTHKKSAGKTAKTATKTATAK